MEFEDDNEKDYYNNLEARVKILESKYSKLTKEVAGPENDDIKNWENNLYEMKEIKKYFDENIKENSNFIDSFLDEFKELALYHINKDKINSIEDKELIQEENEENKKQIQILKDEIKKLKEKENKYQNTEKDNYLNSYDKNSVLNKSNHVGKLNRNKNIDDALIYNEMNYQNTKESVIEQTIDLLSKRSQNDSKDSFWHKYNYYDPNDLKKGNNNNQQNKNGNGNYNNNSNSNQEINKLMSSNNNNRYAIGNSSEGISSNMRKYSPYILNKKSNY